MIQYIGLFWLAVLFLSAWTLIGLIRTPMGWKAKSLWTVVILLLPIFGAAAWIFVGSARARA